MVAVNGLKLSQESLGFPATESVFLASISLISLFPSTRLLRSEQLSSHHVYIGECRSDLEPAQVLRHAPVTGLAEAEDVLHHAEHVVDVTCSWPILHFLDKR